MGNADSTAAGANAATTKYNWAEIAKHNTKADGAPSAPLLIALFAEYSYLWNYEACIVFSLFGLLSDMPSAIVPSSCPLPLPLPSFFSHLNFYNFHVLRFFILWQ